MTTPARVAKIKDPHRRLEAATHLLDTAQADVDEYLAQRDMAMIVARLDHGIEPVALWRDVLGVSRGLFNRVLSRSPSDEVRKGIVAAYPALFDNPVETMRRADRAVKAADAVVTEARKIRNQTAMRMMSGRNDDGERVPPVPNAEIARITGLTTARVSQLRQGKR